MQLVFINPLTNCLYNLNNRIYSFVKGFIAKGFISIYFNNDIIIPFFSLFAISVKNVSFPT